MTLPPGVILAGGAATRMGGGDKGLLQLGDSTILDQVIDRLSPQVSQLALNANGDLDRFSAFGLPVISDSIPDRAGPLAGILAAMDWAHSIGAHHVVTAAADTPFFPGNLVKMLGDAATRDAKPIALASTPDPVRKFNRHPTFGLWPVELREDLRSAIQNGTRKIVAWTDEHGTALAEFSNAPFDPFFNVNTPEDLEAAGELVGKI